jgi:glutaredoxin
MSPTDPKADDEAEVFDLSTDDTEVPAGWAASAVYTLDQPVRCPHCREIVRLLKVVRLTRTQAAFTSTLPRAGRAIICPYCEKILSVELSGIL